jgi:hypothetical protein
MIIERTVIRPTDPFVPHCGGCGRPQRQCACPKRRPTTADLIVAFLVAVREARVDRIVRYMSSTPLATPAETTRNRISHLMHTGQIERVGYGRYRAADQADQRGER